MPIFPLSLIDQFWFSMSAPAEEKRLLALINDARVHPEKYPPHGNSAGASMAGCTSPFRTSRALTLDARDHSDYLRDPADVDWIKTDGNAHQGRNGLPTTGDSGLMAQDGFVARAENVAFGFAMAEEVVQSWMQDDEARQWGHRNNILACEKLEAGVGHCQGGPWGHYWTLDMGTK
ncbi:CAP domain-containing protein [Streptomyces sp. NPDC021100]|uniref:CAP domain-containing protein n=1 Tax=Streptomyces sp. NPDC021100 TaxID=3365114 RepID=UPI0037914C1D